MGKWIVPLRRGGSRTLLCFPFGGGGAAAFANWPAHLPEDVDVWAVRLPGRENRAAEPLVTDADAVVEALFDEVRAFEAPVFYGHSLGAGLAVQLADLLRARGERIPSLFILSGRLPPHRPYPGRRWGLASDEELAARVGELGGAPADVLRNEAFLRLFLPRIRADFLLNDALAYRRLAPFDAPITIINGEDDDLARPELLDEWRGYTTRGFASYLLKGGHFFLYDDFPAFLRIVAAAARTAGVPAG